MTAFDFRTTIQEYEANLLFSPQRVEDICWSSFLKTCAADDVSHDDDAAFVIKMVRHRCEYRESLAYPVGHVVVRMQVSSLAENEVGLRFEHHAGYSVDDPLVARGEQDLHCFVKFGDRFLPYRWPANILRGMQAIMMPSDRRRLI